MRLFILLLSVGVNQCFGLNECSGTKKCSKPCKISETTVLGTLAPTGDICSGELIFEDNFGYFDTKKWRRENTLSGGGNGEFQWYTQSENNSFVKNGALHIKPTFVSDTYGNGFLYSGTIDLGNSCTESFSNGCKRTGSLTKILNPIQSAKLTTKDSFSFKYGKMEIRAWIPSGDWLWPAIWMYPKNSVYGGWPASGEIDVVEAVGNKIMKTAQGFNIGDQVSSTLHWGPNPYFNRYYLTHFEKNNSADDPYHTYTMNWSSESVNFRLDDNVNNLTLNVKSDDMNFNDVYHTYTMDWSSKSVKFLVDDIEIGTVNAPSEGFWQLGNLSESGLPNPWNSTMAPFDKEFFIIINLAIGGTNGYFPDNIDYGKTGKPWNNKSPNAVTEFWEEMSSWDPTWHRKDVDSRSHLKVDYVRVWAV